MPIVTSVDTNKDLTIQACTGEVLFEDMMLKLKQFWEKNPTRFMLWDFRQGSLKQISCQNMEKVIEFVSQHAHKRKGGKTAVVAPGDLEYGMSRVADIMLEMKQPPFRSEVFRSLEEARQWLFGSHEPGKTH